MRSVLSVITLALFGASSLVLAASPAAHAQIAAIDFAGSNTSTASTTSTRGFVFDITAPVTVIGLSVFDFNADGLGESHDVGLWDSAGTLLASANVPSGTAAPLDSSGKFRFVTLPSAVTLSVGTGYRVGAVLLAGTPELQFFDQTNLTSAPGVTYVGGAFINNGVASLTFPSSDIGSGISGGSFVVGSGDPVAAPEPATLALLAMGLLPVAGAVIRRRRA